MTTPPIWLETVRGIWETFRSSSGKDFEKCCEKSLLYLYTVKASDEKEDKRIEDLRDILFDSENTKQVSCYLGSEDERDRMRYYVAITGRTLSVNVKLKRAAYATLISTPE